MVFGGYWRPYVDYPKYVFKRFIRDLANCPSRSLNDMLRQAVGFGKLREDQISVWNWGAS